MGIHKADMAVKRLAVVEGKELAAKIADLKELVAVYRGGIIKEKLE